MIRKTCCAVAALLLAILTFDLSESHPWGGLVVDQNGDIYFTFICPLVDDDHYACVMKIDSGLELSEVLKSSRSPSDIVLSRTPYRKIFAAERTGISPAYRNTLWNIQGNPSQVLSTSNQDLFHIQALAVTDSGSVYFAKSNQIFLKETFSDAPVLIYELENRISLITYIGNERLYVISGGTLFLIEGNEVKPIANGLRKDSPDNLPFRGANILFDITVDDDENAYIAYYGNREVLKISPDGNIETILTAEEPWSPHGVDFYKGELYVLESTIGISSWWKFWEEEVEIAPRIRKIDSLGNVSTIYSYVDN